MVVKYKVNLIQLRIYNGYISRGRVIKKNLKRILRKRC
jgi:hypothetical protein